MSQSDFEPWTVERLRAEVVRCRLQGADHLDLFDEAGHLRCYWTRWHGWFTAPPRGIGTLSIEEQVLHDINTLRLYRK